VLYFGADSLAEDKLGCFGMTTLGNALCDQFLGKQNISLVPLGGCSYTVKNVALPWTYKMACALWIENEIDPYLPWNDYFEWLAPRYQLEVLGNDMYDFDTKNRSLWRVRCDHAVFPIVILWPFAYVRLRRWNNCGSLFMLPQLVCSTCPKNWWVCV
jgi:hypothetical protein